MRHARPDYDRIQDPAGLIPADEPVFLIRGQDLAGPNAVRTWAYGARARGADERMVRAALQQAVRMEAWQHDGYCKVPDLPKGTA